MINVPATKLNAGLTEVKFEFRLKAAKEPKLYETYHGVFVNINYLVKCELKRSFLAKSIQKSQQFVIQYKVNFTYLPIERKANLNIFSQFRNAQRLK